MGVPAGERGGCQRMGPRPLPEPGVTSWRSTIPQRVCRPQGLSGGERLGPEGPRPRCFTARTRTECIPTARDLPRPWRTSSPGHRSRAPDGHTGGSTRSGCLRPTRRRRRRGSCRGGWDCRRGHTRRFRDRGWCPSCSARPRHRVFPGRFPRRVTGIGCRLGEGACTAVPGDIRASRNPARSPDRPRRPCRYGRRGSSRERRAGRARYTPVGCTAAHRGRPRRGRCSPRRSSRPRAARPRACSGGWGCWRSPS